MTTDTDDLSELSDEQLNREAAEVRAESMGWSWYEHKDGAVFIDPLDDPEVSGVPFRPATDPADALELLEGVAERLHKPRIKEIIEHPVDEWSVHITSHTAGNLLDFHVFETDKSKARAQTIAAIKAWRAMQE